MGNVTLAPPADGAHPTISAHGRIYTCLPGQTIPVPDFDAAVLLANGWTTAGFGFGSGVAGRGIAFAAMDGAALILTYTDGTSDRLGPLTAVSLGSASTPGASLTVDPSTGDVFQTTGG